MSERPPCNGILSGCRAFELGDEKGYFCGKLLAGMGAEVVRIDRPGTPVPADYFCSGKRSLSLDIEQTGGRALFRRLAAEADIIIETFMPGYLPGLRMGYRGLSRTNPGLIQVSITDFGQTGPYSQYRSSDLIAASMGGQLSVCGERDKAPLKAFGPQAYYAASLFGAIGVMLAIHERRASGKGQYIDISVQECVAGTLDHVLVRYFHEGIVAERAGAGYWNGSFRLFPCRDGYILLSMFDQWEVLIRLLDSEGKAGDLGDGKWLDREYRRANLPHIIYVLEQWTGGHSVRELLELGQLMRFPWARVSSIPDVANNLQLNARGYFVQASERGSDRMIKYPGAPFKMGRSPWLIDPVIPQAGEANQDIFHHELGLAADEVERLRAEGVI
jgi:benzylsuccinate CoA-transferase BbsE subunit